MDLLLESKPNKAIYSQECTMKNKNILQRSIPHVTLTNYYLQNLDKYLVALHSNGTAREKVTVIGRDQIGSLGQMDGAYKNPMY